MIKWYLSQGCKNFSISTNQSNIHKLKNKNHMIISIDTENFWQHSTSIYDKNSPQSQYRGNIPQRNNNHI